MQYDDNSTGRGGQWELVFLAPTNFQNSIITQLRCYLAFFAVPLIYILHGRITNVTVPTTRKLFFGSGIWMVLGMYCGHEMG